MDRFMDDIRKQVDRMNDDEMMSVKDAKALVHSVCGYAESLVKLKESFKTVDG